MTDSNTVGVEGTGKRSHAGQSGEYAIELIVIGVLYTMPITLVADAEQGVAFAFKGFQQASTLAVSGVPLSFATKDNHQTLPGRGRQHRCRRRGC